MPNTFKELSTTTGVVAGTAMSLLYPDLVLGKLINMDFSKEFVPGVGAVINVRRPITLVARTKTYKAATALVVDNITEPGFQQLTIDTEVYSAVSITDEEMNFDMRDFADQVIRPQTEAMAYAIEDRIAAQLVALPAAGVAWATDVVASLNAARTILRNHSVPLAGLRCVVSPDISEKFLNLPDIRLANLSGSTGALRDAYIGKVVGFDLVESNLLPAGTGYVFHRDAITLASRAPKVPDGAYKGEIRSANGVGIRWIQDYDPLNTADRSIFSTFIGAATLAMTERLKNGTVSTYIPGFKITATGS